MFEAYKTKALTLADKVNLLQFKGMASHGFGDGQTFVVDFTLGYDQILCIEFHSDFEYSNIAWLLSDIGKEFLSQCCMYHLDSL